MRDDLARGVAERDEVAIGERLEREFLAFGEGKM